MPVTKRLITEWNKKLSEAADIPLSIEFANKTGTIDIEKYYRNQQGFIPFGESLTVQIVSPLTKQGVYVMHIGSQPGLCGCMYFTGLNKQYSIHLRDHNRKPMAVKIIEFLKAFAKEMDYRSITCSSIVPSEDYSVPYPTPKEAKNFINNWTGHKFKQNLLACGFTVSQDFINARTKNRINIYHIKL